MVYCDQIISAGIQINSDTTTKRSELSNFKLQHESQKNRYFRYSLAHSSAFSRYGKTDIITITHTKFIQNSSLCTNWKHH